MIIDCILICECEENRLNKLEKRYRSSKLTPNLLTARRSWKMTKAQQQKKMLDLVHRTLHVTHSERTKQRQTHRKKYTEIFLSSSGLLVFSDDDADEMKNSIFFLFCAAASFFLYRCWPKGQQQKPEIYLFQLPKKMLGALVYQIGLGL